MTKGVGLMTIARERQIANNGGRVRVMFDGVDVTQSCFVADDRQGYVGLLARDDAGRFVIDADTHGVKREIRLGPVEIQVEPGLL